MAAAVFTSLQQLFDNSGDPLNGGSVTVYQDGTTTLISLFSDEGLGGGSAAANPITLDSAGRHAMRYFAAESYKVLIKNSAGTTLVTLDDIDPSVPLGTGVLAVANGGTGASIAATARTNLGAASTAELAVLSAEVAALSGTLASTEKTHIATGTTAQRTASPVVGDIRHNTTTGLYEAYNGADWDAFATTASDTDTSASATQEGLIELAIQSEMETATDVVRAVTPGLMLHHPGVAKAWAKFATDGTLNASYNVTGVVKDSVGDWTVTLGTDFGTADYSVNLSVLNAANIFIRVVTQAAGTFTIKATDVGGTDADPTTIYFQCFGDFA
jgi:hypothetical protein